MGKLAPFAIVGGKKVPVTGIVAEHSTTLNDPFCRSALERAGYIDIAEKIAARAALSVADVTRLLAEAPVPVLLKLVDFVRGQRVRRQAEPVVFLPLQRWVDTYGFEEARRRATWFLEQIDQDDLRVVIDRLSPEMLGDTLADVISEITSHRAGLTVVGPSADDILAGIIGQQERVPNPLETVRFGRTLSQYRQAGIKALMPGTLAGMASVIHEAGLVAPLIVLIDRFESPRSLGETLLRLNEISGAEQIVKTWGPGLQMRNSNRIHHAARDVLLLRTLAVGAVSLTNVPNIRGTSRFFSYEAIRMAAHFGANDPGVGALNQETADTFGLLPLDAVSASFPGARHELESHGAHSMEP